MLRTKKFKSIHNLETEIKKNDLLMVGIIGSITLIGKLRENSKLETLKDALEKYKEFFDFDENRKNDVWQLGFIRLFASFESFMYDFMSEMFTWIPESLPKDIKIDIDSILNLKTQKSTYDYIVDHISIQYSYDLNTWEKKLADKFGIIVFENIENKQMFFFLNSYRNMLLHSGGKFNSKASRDLRNFFILNPTAELPKDFNKKILFEVEKIEGLADASLYEYLKQEILKIISQIKKKYKAKSKTTIKKQSKGM